MQKEKYIKVQAVPVKRIDKAQAGLLKTNLEDVLKELEKMQRKLIETENQRKAQMKISKQYVIREILGEHIIVPTGQEAIRFQGIIAVNETGAFLVRYLQEHDADEEELTQALCRDFEIDSGTARKDIEDFIESVHRQGVLLVEEKKK